ncbi:pentapeptide repeat-containing protein [Nostoc sp. FACHB-133]|uniref:pentapeptide repeat-containing protein n=1 Tax=Nostoc sp. FACHB-133 TaxID=2692835 RepID=UPI001688841C|nr:pentapeptide repeat-containing protein [Nostoc sp. FACHB-133]MBD2521406.1 pentapeptide repeat-containing protein [Nostoc sp. FACHB-133]
MLNKQENQQATDYSETEQHLKRQECYIPPKNRFARFLKWTGFENKTLWDILQLVGLSVVVTVISIVLTQCHQRYEKNRDQERYEYEKNRDQERYQQTALENYFKEMTDILVEKKLGTLHHIHTDNQPFNHQDSISQSIDILEELEPNDRLNKEQRDRIVEILKEIKDSQLKELEAIARAQTLTTLNLLRLGTKRRDLLINFLRETTLATKDRTCVERDDKSERCKKQEQEANLLIGINLNSLQLPKINLDLFILKKADFGNANLSQAFLSQADLRGSNLSGSNLSQASMINTNLREANLTKSDLKRANLGGANLTNANLTNADLTNATPPSLKSQYARPELAEQDFPNTYLCNTTMPNGYISKRDCEKRWQQKFD